MSDIISKEIAKVLINKVQKNMDLDSIAKKIAPEIEKDLIREIKHQIRDGDLLCDMDLSVVIGLMEEAIANQMANKLGLKLKKRK